MLSCTLTLKADRLSSCEGGLTFCKLLRARHARRLVLLGLLRHTVKESSRCSRHPGSLAEITTQGVLILALSETKQPTELRRLHSTFCNCTCVNKKNAEILYFRMFLKWTLTYRQISVSVTCERGCATGSPPARPPLPRKTRGRGAPFPSLPTSPLPREGLRPSQDSYISSSQEDLGEGLRPSQALRFLRQLFDTWVPVSLPLCKQNMGNNRRPI